MTTFIHRITLSDSESIALEAALHLMMTHCNEKLAAGEKAPYWAHRSSVEAILGRIHDDSIQTSGNNFDLGNPF